MRYIAYCQKWQDKDGNLVAYTLHCSKQMWRYVMGTPGENGDMDKNHGIRAKALMRLGLPGVLQCETVPMDRPYVCEVSAEVRAQLDEKKDHDDESRLAIVVVSDVAPEAHYLRDPISYESQRREKIRRRALAKMSPEQRRAFENW